ncbi:MAG: hypothetical protein A4E74_01606 [Syntrophus sp. PtaB.Bin075]|nr:MAG: hypothetical protein A4E74_01606 [Syntrophus sp. PtaB.Bin075]
MKRNVPIEALQFQLMNLFDHIPTHTEVIGNPANRAESKQIQNNQSKGSGKSMLPHHKRQIGPPKGVASVAFYSMKGKYKETPLTPHRSQMKTPCFLSFKGKFTLPALWTANVFFFHICKIFDDVTREACCSISNTLQIESMIKNRCGHGLEPPFVVRLVSNNRALAMSM